MITKNGHGGKIHSLAKELGVDPVSILDFSASINPLGPPPGLIESLQEGLGSLILHYPPAGAEFFQTALANNVGIGPDNIIVGNGSTELIHLLPRLKDRGRALIIEPAFSEYRAGLDSCDWWVDAHVCTEEAAFVPDGSDRGALLERIEEGFDLVYLGRPANPGGEVADRDLVLSLARAQERHGLMVLDQAFIDFCPGESLLPRLAGYPALVILGSLTKFYAIPGLRLGFLAASEETAERLKKLQPPWSVNILAQEAGRICLAGQAEYRTETERLIQPARAGLAEDLARLGFKVFPSRANYLLARTGPDLPLAPELARRMAEELILIRDCSNYPGLDERYFRVSVRLPEENQRLVEAFKKVL